MADKDVDAFIEDTVRDSLVVDVIDLTRRSD